MIAQALEDIVLQAPQCFVAQPESTSALHLFNGLFQRLLSFFEGRRLMRERPRVVPLLQALFIECIEYADSRDPRERPLFEIGSTFRRIEEITAHVGPAKS